MCNLKGYYYRIRVNTTPAAYKKIGVFGWWLIEMRWKFVQFLIKKAPKSGLLGKKRVRIFYRGGLIKIGGLFAWIFFLAYSATFFIRF